MSNPRELKSKYDQPERLAVALAYECNVHLIKGENSEITNVLKDLSFYSFSADVLVGFLANVRSISERAGGDTLQAYKDAVSSALEIIEKEWSSEDFVNAQDVLAVDEG